MSLFVVSLAITATTIILQEIVKVLYETMLKAIDSY